MEVFTKFRTAIKIREVSVDNEIFQLHYRVTALLLLGSAALVASKQHFGDPIDCITRDDVPSKLLDTYCWIHSTFTLPSACNKTVGIEVPHPCVDKYGDVIPKDRVYHKYYQWVYFVLFFQATCFYAPHLFWKSQEKKLLFTLTSKQKDPLRAGAIKKVVKYLMRTKGERHLSYFYYFTLAEIINFINVVLQIYVVDEFLGGTFTTYGLDVLNYIQLDQEDRVDPMVRVFPRMTKCSFHRFGASGDVQKYDALCILPLNIINEKIYITMWFWFVFLAVITGIWLIYRLLTFTHSSLRYWSIKRRANFTNYSKLKYVIENKTFDIGDWFLLSMMCKNMDPRWFRILVNKLSKYMRAEERDAILRKFPTRAEGVPVQVDNSETERLDDLDNSESSDSDNSQDEDED